MATYLCDGSQDILERLKKSTASGCEACNCSGAARWRRQKGWLRKWREEGQHSGRGRRLAGKGAKERRRLSRVIGVMALAADEAKARVAELEAERRRRGCSAAGAAVQRELRGWEEEHELLDE